MVAGESGELSPHSSLPVESAELAAATERISLCSYLSARRLWGESPVPLQVRRRVVQDYRLHFRLPLAALASLLPPVPEPDLSVRRSSCISPSWPVKSLSSNILHITRWLSKSGLDWFPNPLTRKDLETREGASYRTQTNSQWPGAGRGKYRCLGEVRTASCGAPARCPSAHPLKIVTLFKPAGPARLRAALFSNRSGRRNHLPGDRRCPSPDS
jgi:hypothetical protein